MQLAKCKDRSRCEMGSCKSKADYTIKMERVGIKSAINICARCMNELYSLLGEEVIPKSIETVKKQH